MVLLFLGVIFLLLGWQAVGSSNSSDDDNSSPATSVGTSASAAAATGTSTSTKPAGQADVRVYNISGKDLVAKRTADQLKAAGFNVTDVGNRPAESDVTVTTVYYSEGSDSEKSTAEAVAQKLGGAPVEPRISSLGNDGPGVIVLAMG